MYPSFIIQQFVILLQTISFEALDIGLLSCITIINACHINSIHHEIVALNFFNNKRPQLSFALAHQRGKNKWNYKTKRPAQKTFSFPATLHYYNVLLITIFSAEWKRWQSPQFFILPYIFDPIIYSYSQKLKVWSRYCAMANKHVVIYRIEYGYIITKKYDWRIPIEFIEHSYKCFTLIYLSLSSFYAFIFSVHDSIKHKFSLVLNVG